MLVQSCVLCDLPTRLPTLMLKPALALVSMNMTLNSRALASPSSIDTCLQTANNLDYMSCNILSTLPNYCATHIYHRMLRAFAIAQQSKLLECFHTLLTDSISTSLTSCLPDLFYCPLEQ